MQVEKGTKLTFVICTILITCRSRGISNFMKENLCRNAEILRYVIVYNWLASDKMEAYAELIGIGLEIIQVLLLFPRKAAELFSGLSRLIKPDIVNIHFARTARDCHVAPGAQANGNPVNVSQNDALIGQS